MNDMNITAGLIAKKMGLPIDKFIASHNVNDTFPIYLETGNYAPKPSVVTYANAMDVGAPSNFERIEHLYKKDVNLMRNDISAYNFTNPEILEEIKSCFQSTNYLVDPHGAVGKLGLQKELNENEIGVFLETAHPQKFADAMLEVIPGYNPIQVNLTSCKKEGIENDYNQFINKLY